MNKQHSSLSRRGTLLAENPARIAIELFLEAAENLYCPDENPEGAFPIECRFKKRNDHLE